MDECILCVALGAHFLSSLKEQMTRAERWADLVELRLDKLHELDPVALSSLLKTFSLPLILTLRKKSHGGDFRGTEEERHHLLRFILKEFQPDYLDLEGDTPREIIEDLRQLSPKTQLIISWHDLEKTPDDLNALFRKISFLPASYYKIATTALSTLDAVRMLAFTQEVNRKGRILCGICMGELGEVTRILSPIAGQPLTFASLEKGNETASGQLTADEIVETYRFRELNRSSQVLALIGNPVDKSYSHLTHNAVLKSLSLNAVYVKFLLSDEEILPFFELIISLPIAGFSVTMPLKEQVLPLISSGKNLFSCNTLRRSLNQWEGINTDGIGALKALAFPCYKDLKIVIIGAGGTAKGIAAAAKEQGADVVILNRTIGKGRAVARELGVRWGALDDLPGLVKEGYRCMIQATSVGMAPAYDEIPVPAESISSDLIGLDVISNPPETLFLKELKKKGGRGVGGSELFIHQAVEQFVYWFGPNLSKENIESVIRSHLPKGYQQSVYRVKKSSLSGSLLLPPSKSHTIRAVLLGAMAKGTSVIRSPLDSPDTEAAIQAARAFGANVEFTPAGLTIKGVAGVPKEAVDVIDVGNSGQVLRFGGALAALGDAITLFTGDESIRTNRPVQVLLDGLNELGACAVSTRGNGYAPYSVKGPLKGGRATVEGEDSQPVSALLMAAAFIEGKTVIEVKNSGEKPWLALTLSWLDRLGVEYTHRDLEYFEVRGKRVRPAFELTIPSDLSSLAFPLAAALITRSEIVIEGVDLNDVQGDKALIQVLEQMGASFEIDSGRRVIRVLPGSRLNGIVIDVNAFIDAVPILAVLGCFAEGETRLINASIARKKECNRLSCMVEELKKMGAWIEESDDGLDIHRSDLRGASLRSHGDHRVAMSLIIAGLGAEGETEVEGIDCIKKSYPSFLDDLNQLIHAEADDGA